jgi:hypothetical protein
VSLPIACIGISVFQQVFPIDELALIHLCINLIDSITGSLAPMGVVCVAFITEQTIVHILERSTNKFWNYRLAHW